MQQGQQVCSQCAARPSTKQAPPSHTCMQLAKHQATTTKATTTTTTTATTGKKKNLNFGLKFGMQIKKNARNVGKKESGDLEL
jgi:hypothetical protein